MEITEKKENRIMDNHNSDAMELTMNLVRIDSTDPGAYEGEIGRSRHQKGGPPGPF